MSKIGKKLITIPDGVEVKIDGQALEAKGPKGTLALDINPKAQVKVENGQITVRKMKEDDPSKEAGAIWGLTRSLVNNIVVGVSQGYQKKLELQGVGFRMNVQGKKIVMALGFSHPVEKEIPEGIEAKIEETNVLSISGIDKQKVGQFAAEIKKLKPVEPYKGKGFRYQGEKVRRKAGKKAATSK
jgi:large subunit ribosomal protein L6